MNRRVVLVIAIVLALATAGATTWYYMARGPQRATGTHAEADVWTCPMHPEVRESKPGRCPKCGMELVRASSIDAPHGTGAGAPE